MDNSESQSLKMDVFAKDLEAVKIIPIVKKGEVAGSVNGIFGREFGSVLPKDGSYERNNVDAIVDEFYLPEGFYKYTTFKAFATPDTRKVFMIRAVCQDDDSEIVDKTVEMMQMLVGKSFKDDDDGNKYAVCSGKNGEVLIQIEKHSGWISLDVTDFKLYKLSQDEHKQRARKASAADLDAL